MSSAGNSAKFEITDAKLHVPMVTLSTKNSVNLTKQLTEEFERSVYLNSYQKSLHELLNASFEGVRRLFVLASLVAAGATNDEAGMKDNRKYFLRRGEINKYNVLIDGRNFYDQPISDLVKQYESEKYQQGTVMIIQKPLDADPRAI